MGLLQPETVAGTLQELKTTSHATLKFRTWADYVIPNIWLQRPGEVVAVSTNIEIADKKKCSSIASWWTTIPTVYLL